MLENKQQIYLPLGACEICSHLDDVETSFSKHGWEEMSYSMPLQAGQLIPAKSSEGYDQLNHQIKRCPICEIYYQYDYEYEYLVNGSEDVVTLTRLTPADVRAILSAEKYSYLIKQGTLSLNDPDDKTRAYAARCLVAHHLSRDELIDVERYITDSDEAVVQGAVFQVKFYIENQADSEELRVLVPALRKAFNLLVNRETNLAGYLLKYVFDADGS